MHSIRPERIRIVRDGVAAGEVAVDGTVADVQYLGADSRVRVLLGGDHLERRDDTSRRHLLVSVPSNQLADVGIGGAIRLAWPRDAAFTVADTTDDTPDTGGEEDT